MMAVCSEKLGHRGGNAVVYGRTVLVGLGNEIAGDDGAGIHVARQVGRSLPREVPLDIVELPWAGFHLLDALRGYDRAILVDTLCTGRRAPGTVTRLREEDLTGAVRLISYHDLNYPTVLAFGAKLGYEMPRQVYLLGIEGETLDRFHDGLTPAVIRGVHRATRMILRMVHRWSIPSADVDKEQDYDA